MAVHPRRLVGTLALLGCGLALGVAAHAADYTGLVHARHQLTLSVAVPGVVARVVVQPGMRVAAQAPLLLLDDRIQAAEEQRRKVVLDDQSETRATEERLKIVQPLAEDARKLVGTRGAISREDAARAELDWVATRGRLAQLEVQKKRERIEHQAAELERQQRRLLAPVAGVVTKVGIDVGEWARPGDALVELVDAAELHLRVNVPAAAARSLKAGAALQVGFEPALGLAPVQGQVSFISPAVDASSGLTALRVHFANPGGRIPPGIKGLISIAAGAAK